MFNTTQQTVRINAVSGTIVKNYRDSFILRFHMKSEMADLILDKRPRLKEYDCKDAPYKPVVVLQVMLCGEQEFLAEVMWKEDFDKMFEPQAESEG